MEHKGSTLATLTHREITQVKQCWGLATTWMGGVLVAAGSKTQNFPEEECQVALSPFAYGTTCQKEKGGKSPCSFENWSALCPDVPLGGFKVATLPVVREGGG